MRKFWINSSYILLTTILFSCGGPELKIEEVDLTPPPIDSAVLPPPPPMTEKISPGDLNNDKFNDTITITMPAISGEMECADSTCTTYFAFEGNSFPSFKQEQALGGVIGNAGDLDDDGICELYFVPDWFTSNWSSFSIYSLKNNQWKRIANASIRRDDGTQDSTINMPYQKRIIKHTKEYFEIVENVMNEDGEENLVPNKFYFK